MSLKLYTNEIALVLSIILTSFSQLLLRIGAKKADKELTIFNLYTVLGYALFLVVMLLMIYAMQKITLRTAMALNSITYILTPIVAHYFIKDDLTKSMLFGSSIIIVGIVIFYL